MRSSTSRRHTPDSITACIFSLGPSDRYDNAQQVSARTSLSWWKRRRASNGSAGDTYNHNHMPSLVRWWHFQFTLSIFQLCSGSGQISKRKTKGISPAAQCHTMSSVFDVWLTGLLYRQSNNNEQDSCWHMKHTFSQFPAWSEIISLLVYAAHCGSATMNYINLLKQRPTIIKASCPPCCLNNSIKSWKEKRKNVHRSDHMILQSASNIYNALYQIYLLRVVT